MRKVDSIQIGFDYWGHGNIGEDLTLRGFLDVAPKTDYYAYTAHNKYSQKLRFPEVEWNGDNGRVWVAVGDTPFQVTCGHGILQQMMHATLDYGTKYMVNVGVESEIKSSLDIFADIAILQDKISTRDKHSADILRGLLGVDRNKVFVGSDLAHISLSKIEPMSIKKHKMGLIIAGDTLSKSDIGAVDEYISVCPYIVSFIAGDIRDIAKHEVRIYKQIKNPQCFLSVPDYETEDISDLIEPINECETILSSRYHGIMAAAWMGCKVGAIARSSKIPPLAKELSIPVCHLPLTKDKLMELGRSACTVPTKTLLRHRDKAIEGVKWVL